jgi:hypothetical protein
MNNNNNKKKDYMRQYAGKYPDSLLKEVKAIAKYENRSLNGQIIHILKKYVDNIKGLNQE